MTDANIILLDTDGKRRMVCQFVIDLSSKKNVEDVIKLIRDMAKVDPEPEKSEKV